MSTAAKQICEQASHLPDAEKLALVDELLAQLDRPDPDLERVWADEARKRREAYRQGHIEAASYEEVLKGFRQPR